jgi:hypothetical protein
MLFVIWKKINIIIDILEILEKRVFLNKEEHKKYKEYMKLLSK